ncbi:MAG: hypothetical protein OQJ77_00340 [Thiovulaceae bacterium]|nr:hypothetical protein [Sulfurimonadaceae bacterium]MCW9025737.1 hypothetical protein [Sulfurimonadaceae bacterium]
MYKLTIFLIVFFANISANSTIKAQLPYNESINLVSSIQTYGIKYGNGQQNVYVFVDPLCRYSRKFISMISKKPKMLSKYKYIIYLYEIPRLHSKNTIAAIYNSKEPVKVLLEVMLEDKKISIMPTTKTQTTVDAISKIAQKLHITKRPSIIVEK